MLTAMRGASSVNFVAVTPKAAVSPEPSAEPAKDPPFRMDISVANSVASTPCHIHLVKQLSNTSSYVYTPRQVCDAYHRLGNPILYWGSNFCTMLL